MFAPRKTGERLEPGATHVLDWIWSVQRTMRENAETVILVHGLWMRGIVFSLYKRWLTRSGFSVRLFSYPSVRRGLDANAGALARFAGESRGAALHFVGHSLGGAVILSMLARHADPRTRRVVIMGSPCAGSHCASVLQAIPVLRGILGQSIRDWLARPLPRLPANVAIGVLAGNRGIGLGRLIPGLPRPNDGVVALAETRLPGSADVITLRVAHAEMLVSRTCAAQVATFLHEGRFRHA